MVTRIGPSIVYANPGCRACPLFDLRKKFSTHRYSSLAIVGLAKSRAILQYRLENTCEICARASAFQDQVPQDWPYLTPLLLAFFASQNRSFFAAKCLVQCVVELYESGQRWEDIQVELKLAGMQEGKEIEQLPAAAHRKARLLVENEKDVLLQWIALILMTLKELGVKQGATELSALDGDTQMAKGMRAFVRQNLDLGYSLEKLQLQQQMAADERGVIIPSVKLMQENSRLIVLTSEIVKGTREVAGSQYGAEASPEDPTQNEAKGLTGEELRPSSARVLLAFLGAARGSLYSVNAFREGVFGCYRKGWSAQQIFTALRPEEFASGQTLFPVATTKGSGQTNADIFAQWVSTVYITLAQVGVPHKAAGESLGWAWAGSGGEDDAVAASRISYFVSTTLEHRAEEEGDEVHPSEALKQIREQPAQPPEYQGPGIVTVDDPSLRDSSSAIGLMSQLLNLIILTRDLAKSAQRAPRTP